MTTEKVKAAVSAFVAGSDSPAGKLQSVCNLLRKEIEGYDWVGYYLVDRNALEELVLGPFAGVPTEHDRIGFGEGICGQAADTLQVFVVDDVNAEANYLSCSPHVKSEYVAPVTWNGKLVGELDLDSDQLAAFGPSDIEFLNWVAGVTGETVALAAGFQFAE